METIQLIELALLAIIVAETSYLAFRTLKKSIQNKNDLVFIDTSVLMDGRIIEIAKTGFLPGNIVITRSVIGEMQLLADKADNEKRERARRGLDVVRELQDIDNLSVQLMQDGSFAKEGVDERLLMLAKKHSGVLCTIDYNLNKVAQVEGITVLNVNELAQNLRMSYLPGDKLQLQLTSTGSESQQAVGHLADGTMVVVEQAKKYIGTSVDVEIIRSLQTAAGRMMFAKRVNQESAQSQRNVSPKSPKGRKPEPKKVKAPVREKPSQTRPVRTPKTPQSSTPHGAATQQKPKAKPARHKTGAEREASLINLIDNK